MHFCNGPNFYSMEVITMTEWEKMVSGQLYNSEADALKELRLRCKRLCHTCNHLSPDQDEERTALLRQLLGKTGEHFHIEPTFWCDYGKNISLGEYFYSNHNLVILDCAPVTFGDHVLVAPNCGFYTAGHPLDAPTRNAALEYAKPIIVGDDVWIGGNVTVLPGVTIGSNVVIGAGSVVVHDIPSHVVAVGNPCRPIKTLEAPVNSAPASFAGDNAFSCGCTTRS